MARAEKFHPQYVTDSEGHQTAVILPIEEYNELLDDLEDLAVAAERVDEPTISHARALAELKEDGLLPD